MNKIINNLENEMVEALSLSLNQPINKKDIFNHEARVFEAIKSLIGIDLDNPSSDLLIYMRTHSRTLKTKKINKEHKSVEGTISLNSLQESIYSSNVNKTKEILLCLLNLSDGRHILEFLLELSLKQDGDSLLLIWSLYKTMNFIGYNNIKDVRNSLILGAESLLSNNFLNLVDIEEIALDKIVSESNLNLKQLQVIGAIYEMNNTNFIRLTSLKKIYLCLLEIF